MLCGGNTITGRHLIRFCLTADDKPAFQKHTQTFPLELVGDCVVRRERDHASSMESHLLQNKWSHLDVMRTQMNFPVWVPRVSCETCGVKANTSPWAAKRTRSTAFFESFAIDPLQASQFNQPVALPLDIDW